jgi:predicted metal-dependent phosphoesterase TrpH
MLIRADLHVHTTYSADSLITPKDLVHYAKLRGLNAIAVTDHNTLEGAYKIAKQTDFLIIPGMEVSSADGHIVALNVKELIPRDLTAIETVKRIHQTGGIAIACHPFVLFKGCLKDAVTSDFDAIETINSRASPFGRSVRLAQATAQRLNLPRVAGTDSHFGTQIGYGYTEIEAKAATPQAIADAIKAGKCSPHGGAVPQVTNLELTVARVKRMLNRHS